MGSEKLEDLIAQKDGLQIKANAAKKKRDELHDTSKKMAKERDTLNAKVRQIRNKVSEHKKRRDEYNERVQHAKQQRNEMIKQHLEMKKEVKDMERSRSKQSGVNINHLKQNLRKLETEQMTQPMSPQKEKKLIETIKGLHKEIKNQEEKLNQDPKLKKALDQKKALKQKAEKIHESVEKMAKKAQEEHQQMIELLQQLDSLSNKTTEIQEKIVMTKIEADKIHKEFINYVNTIHDLEKTISTKERAKDKKKKEVDVTTAQKQADLIFEKFKRGEKLSTEDLMILQKAGLL